MKKKKKVILGLVIIALSIFTVRRIYWYCKYDYKNIVIILSNHLSSFSSDVKPAVSMAVYIDDELYCKNDSLTELYYFCEDKRISLGFHELKVVVDSHFVAKETFFIFPMRWILIECVGDSTAEDVMFWYDSSPIGLM